MTRPNTPPIVKDGRKTMRVKRCCESCGRELGDATSEELEAAVSGAPLPNVADECGCAHAVEQLSRYLQSRDARAWGIRQDGEYRPTWDEIDPAGREQYEGDARAAVRAMVALGWAPKETN